VKDEVCEEMEVGDEVPTRSDPSKSLVLFEDKVTACYAVSNAEFSDVTSHCL
jgi:hypothetical protein